MAIWYIFAILVCCTKKNLATMDTDRNFSPTFQSTYVHTCGLGPSSTTLCYYLQQVYLHETQFLCRAVSYDTVRHSTD
jgi:hypothetical protein